MALIVKLIYKSGQVLSIFLAGACLSLSIVIIVVSVKRDWQDRDTDWK
jgi:hypothetical protein